MFEITYNFTPVLVAILVALPLGIIGGVLLHVYDRIVERIKAKKERSRTPADT